VIKFGMIAIISLFLSCSQSSKNSSGQTKEEEVSQPLIFKKPPSSFADSVVIDRESAVFYNPDSLQMEKIKSENEKKVYKNLTHDCFYMMENARNVIRKYWPRIQIVEVINARYLMFIKNDKSKKVIDLNAKNSICGLYLFDPKKDPEPVDMPNVDTFLGFYFGQ
jgi:hypothetical protein